MLLIYSCSHPNLVSTALHQDKTLTYKYHSDIHLDNSLKHKYLTDLSFLATPVVLPKPFLGDEVEDG